MLSVCFWFKIGANSN